MARGGRLWGIKDPRMLFCYPAWSSPSTIHIGTFRHPHHVAQSLVTRSESKSYSLSFEEALELWCQYNNELIRLYREKAFPIVNFDWDPERYLQGVEKIARRLSLTGKGKGFFEEGLRHHQSFEKIEDEKYRKVYEELLNISEIEEKVR